MVRKLGKNVKLNICKKLKNPTLKIVKLIQIVDLKKLILKTQP